MYGRLLNRKRRNMDQSDIQYILELLNDATAEKDWDKVEEAKETMKEFLDAEEPSEDD